VYRKGAPFFFSFLASYLIEVEQSGSCALIALFLGKEVPISAGQEGGNQSGHDGNEKLQTLLKIKSCNPAYNLVTTENKTSQLRNKLY
jgi:hypothetical protein